MERLQQALKILSDAEKQLRLSSERSTWFTAALLQLGSNQNSEQNAKKINNGPTESARDSIGRNTSHPLLTFRESKSTLGPRTTSGHSTPHGLPSYRRRSNDTSSKSENLAADSRSVDKPLPEFSQTSDTSKKRILKCVNPDKLAEIWRSCIDRCHSKTLRQLLSDFGKLLSISECDGKFQLLYKLC